MITTNNKPRELFSFNELSAQQQKQVNPEDVVDGQEYFVYRSLVYCLNDFDYLERSKPWIGGLQTTQDEGIVVRYPKDTASYPLGDWIIVGRSCM